MGKDFPYYTEQGDSSVVVTITTIYFILVNDGNAGVTHVLRPLPSTGREACKDISAEQTSHT